MTQNTKDAIGERATPRPWKVVGTEIWSEAPRGKVLMNVGGSYGEKDRAARQANLALICRAVNRDHLFDELVAVLTLLHDETADYIRINNLGDVYHNRGMQLARDLLARVKAATPPESK